MENVYFLFPESICIIKLRTNNGAPLIDAKGLLIFEFLFVSAKNRIIHEQVLQALLTVGRVIAKSRICFLYGRFTPHLRYVQACQNQ